MDADVQTFHQDFTAMQRSLDAAAVAQREMAAKARAEIARNRTSLNFEVHQKKRF